MLKRFFGLLTPWCQEGVPGNGKFAFHQFRKFRYFANFCYFGILAILQFSLFCNFCYFANFAISQILLFRKFCYFVNSKWKSKSVKRNKFGSENPQCLAIYRDLSFNGIFALFVPMGHSIPTQPEMEVIISANIMKIGRARGIYEKLS